MNNEAFQSGYAAQAKGLGFLDNPHDSYSDEGRRWIDGYVKSMQDQRAAKVMKDSDWVTRTEFLDLRKLAEKLADAVIKDDMQAIGQGAGPSQQVVDLAESLKKHLREIRS